MLRLRTLAAAAALALPGVAAAELEIVGEIDGMQGAHGRLGEDDAGFGLAARAHWMHRLAGWWLGPELLLQFANPDGLAVEAEDATIGDHWGLRAVAGGRLGFGEMVRPHLYGHLGYGAYFVPGGDFGFGNVVPDRTYSGLSWDAGLGFDFAMPTWLVGLHLGYADIADAAGWVNIGVHAGVRL